MKGSSEVLRVHLDHFIRRQSIRYLLSNKDEIIAVKTVGIVGQEDRALRYDDIRRDEWFKIIRKPDFQRETNAWTPEDCFEFLDSVFNGRIIPSIILWHNQENGSIYVLDGAHRLSVIRAWMKNDWGDKAGDYYSRMDEELIKEAARKTRELVQQKIGLFQDLHQVFQEYTELVQQGQAPKQVMTPPRFAQATFYNRVVGGLQTLSVQWERGNYDSAEQSFLRINRRGQPLDPWEATLIEYRTSSYARSINCIANGGEAGHYWPEPTDVESIDEQLTDTVKSFSDKAAYIHKCLFVPPFKLPVASLNAPLMVAPAYFQKHKYLFEVIPLIVYKEIASAEDDQIRYMKKDAKLPAPTIIRNADAILSSMKDGLEHLISPTHSSKSLSVVPLFYWYNQKGQYARGLLYGFIYWLLAGSDEDITNRKLVLSANRDRFEYLWFHLKSEIATLQERGGAGLKATTRTANFLQAFLQLLHDRPDLHADSSELRAKVIDILREYANITERGPKVKTSRSFSTKDKSLINIREMFEGSVRCHICGGVVNLQYGGVQYDHTEDYALSGCTDPETGKPSHPFCNRHKIQIQACRVGQEKSILPPFSTGASAGVEEKTDIKQLSFEFWGDADYPA